MSLDVSIRDIGNVRILDVRGRATLGEGSDRLHRELRSLIASGWRKVLVNLAEVQQIDSSGISALVRNCTNLVRSGGSLKLVCPPGRVRDALEVTRLLSVIPAFNDEPAALASFQ